MAGSAPSGDRLASRRQGGCLCGSVRYEVDWPPVAQVTCSCRNCQKQAGSALSVVLVFPGAAVRVTGVLRTYDDRGTSGQPVHRRFCPSCGSPVLTETPEAEAQGLIFVKGGSLDDTADLAPNVHYWTDRAQPWLRLPEGGVFLERQELPG